MPTHGMRYCPIVGCKNFRGTAAKDVHFFYASRVNNDVREKWIKSIRSHMPNFPVDLSKFRVCQLHFDSDDMKLSRNRLQLISGAIPKYFPSEAIKMKPDIVPEPPASLQQASAENEFIQPPEDPLGNSKRPKEAITKESSSICSKCAEYTVQMQVMQMKMHKLQEQVKEQQYEINSLHKRNKYLKTFEPQPVKKTEECAVCLEKLTPDDLYSHVCGQSNNKIDIRCQYCMKPYRSTIKLLNHLRVSHNIDKKFYHCTQCPQIFEMTELMNMHKKAHPVEKPKITCEICLQQFFTQFHYDEHKRTQHPDPEDPLLKPFQCAHGTCSERFATTKLLQQHISKTHGAFRSDIFVAGKQLEKKDAKPIFECYVCRMRLPSLAETGHHLQQHIKYRTEPLKAKCSVCWTKLYASEVESHLCVQVVGGADGGSIDCEYCPENFQSIVKLFKHIEAEHAKDKILYRCIDCTGQYPVKILVEYHQAVHTHTKAFKCNKCSKRSFDSLDALENHIKRHNIERLHLCDECGMSFLTARNLARHKLLHGEPKFKCKNCPKMFFNTVALRKHQNFHSKQIYSCHICNSKSTSSSRMLVHIKRHSQPLEKRFACTLCPVKFTMNHRLKHHIATVHTTLRQYQCQYCPRQYKHKGDLNKHLRSHLGEEMYHCSECSMKFRYELELQKHASEHYVEEIVMNIV